MSIAVPKLDTIEFEALLEEVRGRIPRYAPEWTDHNIHDPGITLLELFAWVTDQQVYQLGFVGDAHRQAFANLLGVTSEPARPARGLVWPQSPVPAEIDLPMATPAMSVEHVDVPFLVDLACRLSTAQLDSLVGNNQRGQVSLYATGQLERTSFPASREAEDGANELLLRFDRPILSAGTGGAATGIVSIGVEVENPALGPGERPRDIPEWGPLVFDYRVAGRTWRPVRIARDDTHALLGCGIITLEIPAAPGTDPSELRLRFDQGFFPSAPRIGRLELNTLPVMQLEHRPEAILHPPSTGLPDQTRELSLGGLSLPATSTVAPPLEIEVLGSNGWEHWQQTDSPHDLGPDDQRVLIDIEGDVVRFGNGVNGKIPPFGAQIRHSTFALTSGTDGNLRAGLTWRIGGQDAATWRNRTAIAGGEGTWDAARVSLEARRLARRPAVHLDDAIIREELKALPGFALARVEILPRHHPALPDEVLPGHRTVVVVPEIMRGRNLSNEEAQRFLWQLRARLDKSRLAGDRLHVVLADTVAVRVHARLMIEDGTEAATVGAAARQLLATLLAPLPPAGQADDDAWPLGRAVSTGGISGLLAGLQGVIAVTGLELARADDAFDANDLILAPIQLPRGGEHIIEIERENGGATNAGR